MKKGPGARKKDAVSSALEKMPRVRAGMSKINFPCMYTLFNFKLVVYYRLIQQRCVMYYNSHCSEKEALNLTLLLCNLRSII
jgi:hypothetical protein